MRLMPHQAPPGWNTALCLSVQSLEPGTEVFKSLNKQEVREIAELEFRKTFKRALEHGGWFGRGSEDVESPGGRIAQAMTGSKADVGAALPLDSF